MIRRLIAAGLSISLIVLSPGLPAYQAAAATLEGRAASARVESASPAAGVQAIPGLPQALPLAGASAAVPSADGGASVSAPAAIPEASAFPADAAEQPSQAGAEGASASPSFAPSGARVARVGAMSRVARGLASLFSVKRTAVAATLGVALAVGTPSLGAANQAPQSQLAAAQAPAAVAGEPAQAKPDTLTAKAEAADVKAALGDSVTVTITLTNPTQAEQKIDDLRAALEKAAPAAEAIVSVSKNELVIPAGQSVTVSVQIQVLQIPVGEAKSVELPAYRVEAGAASFTMPALPVAFQHVLAMPKLEGDFNPPKQPLVQDGWQAGWLASLPFFGLLYFLYRRARGVAAPRTSAPVGPSPAREAALAALKALESAPDEKAFYGGMAQMLGRLLTDRLGLRADRGLTFKQIFDIAERSERLTGEQLRRLRAALLERGQSVVFGGARSSAADAARDLALARELVDVLAPASAVPAGSATLHAFGALGFLPALDGLHWGQPYALILWGVAGLVAWRLWSDHRSNTGALTLASTSAMPGPGVLSRLKRWTIGALFAGALIAAPLSAAEPMFSTVRETLMVPVTKIISVLDRSGSMGSPMTGGNGVSKLNAAIAAEKMFLADQAKGTSNQVGETTFDTSVSVIVPMTSDLRVAEAGLQQITLGGGTDIELAIKVTINQFLKRNIVEIDETKHPEAAELKKIMRTKGLQAALKYAQELPPSSPLWTLIVRPDQAKVISFKTDGDSPGDLLGAARLAKFYGIKIYTIGLPADDLKEDVLTQIAQITGGKYARADDPQALAQIYLSISEEIKTPVPVTKVTEKTYRPWLAKWAFLLTVLGFGLAHVPLMRRPSLKVLSVAATLLVAAAPASVMMLAPQSAQAQTLPAQPALTPQLRALEPFSAIPELQEGRRLYAQGDPLAAMKSFLKALEAHPDMPEIYADIGTSFLALGDVERGEHFLRKGLEMAEKQKRADLRGWIYYQLGWSALMDKDLEGADLMLRQALRSAPQDLELKQNAERVQRMIQEQQKQQKDQKDQKDKKGKNQKGKNQQKSKDQQDRAQQRREGQQGQPQQGQQQGQKGEQQEAQSGDQSGEGQQGQRKPGDVLKELEKADQANGGTPAPDPGTFGKMWGIALPLALGAGATSGLFPGSTTSAHAAEAAGQAAATVAYGWGDPAALVWTAIAVVGLTVLMAVHYWQKHSRAKALAPGLAAPSIGQSPMARRAFLKGALGVTAVGLFGAGWADPWIGTREVATNFGGGHDIIVLPDVSNSVVHADDGRFDRMVGSLDGLIAGLEKSNHLDRMAIVPMADTPGDGMLSPYYDAAREQLYDLRQQNFRFKGGTDIAKGIRKAIAVFETAPDMGERQRILIIPTDGGDAIPSPTGDDDAKALYEAIQEARKKGIRIYTIGIGSAGAKMIIPDEVRAKSPNLPKFIQDENGQDVVVRMNAAALEKIAYLGGGKPFMAVAGQGMTQVIDEIAKDERTRTGGKQPTEVVSVKNSVGGWFMVPGAAALAASLYLRGKQALEDADAAKGSAKLHSFAWPAVLPFIAPLLPASVGPQLILGLGTTALLGFWLADRLAGRAYSRRLLDLWLVRTGTLRRDVRRDAAGVLLDAADREIDAKRLDGFLDQWEHAGRGWRRSAARERQRALLALVDAKDDLWREKLLAAYLYEDSAEMRSDIAAALSSLDQRSMAPLRDSLRRVVARTRTVGWLSSDPMTRRLTSLLKREDLSDAALRDYVQSLAEGANPAAREAAYRVLETAPAPAARTWKQRLRGLPVAAGIGALVLGSAAWNAASVQNVIKMDAQRDMVRASVSQDFFGGDAYLLSQSYTDQRIDNDVLPLLRRWETLTPADGPAVQQAIDTLLSSTDPKANQLLMFLYRQRVIFQLDGQVQKQLIRTLVSRDDQDMIAALLHDVERNPKSQAAQQRMAFAISVMGELKNKHSFASLIQLIGNEDDNVRQAALRTVLKVIRDPKNQAQSLDMLKMSLDSYGKEPEIRLLHSPLIMEALAAKKELKAEDIEKARALLTAAVVLDPAKTPGTPDEIAASLQYRAQAFASIAGELDRYPKLKDNPGLRDVVSAAIGDAVSKTLTTGESASGNSARFQAILGRAGLRTVRPSLDVVVSGGRFALSPNAHYGTSESYLDRYYGDQIAAAGKIFADEAAGQAGGDQFDLHQPAAGAYFGDAAKTMEVLGNLAAKIGMDKAPAGADQLEAFVDATASDIIKQLNSPFKGSSWTNFVEQTLGVTSLPTRLSHEQIARMLPAMETTLATGALNEKSRVANNTTALGDREREALTAAIAAVKTALDPATKDAAGLTMFGAQIVSDLGLLGWKEFMTGPADAPKMYSGESGTNYDFAKGYTPAQFDALVARLDKVLADGRYASSTRADAPLTADERAKLEKALVALHGLRDEAHKRIAAPASASPAATLHSFALPALAALWLSAGESKLALAAFAATAIAALWAFFGLGFHKPLPKPKQPVAATQPLEQRRSLLELSAEQIATSPLFGSLESRFKGLSGTEYAESRPPMPGETGGRVDPVTSARMGETYYKIMEQERDAPLVIVADLSGSANAKGAGAVTRRRVIEDAAGALAFAAAVGGDKGIRRSIGLVIVTDRVEAYIEPQPGEDQARRIFDALVNFTPRRGGSRLQAGLDHYLADKQPNSILVPISDFIGASGIGPSLAAAATEGHVVLPVVVEDPLDRSGLAGLGPTLVRDAETGAARLVGDGADGAALARERGAVARAFEGARARPIKLKTDGRHLDDLVRQAQELGS